MDLIAIGASTGGPAALVQILQGLPADFPIPILIVLHLSEMFSSAFVDWLNTLSPVAAHYAKDGEPLPQPGKPQVVLAPAGKHLVVEGKLFTSAGYGGEALVQALGGHAVRQPGGTRGLRALLCLLTGMGKDGAAGLLAARMAGLHTVAQDEASSVIFGMPGEAIRLGAAERILPLDAMASMLLASAQVGRGQGERVILIAVNSRTVRMQIERTLQASGLQTLGAGSLEEARAALAGSACTALVLDDWFPDGRGGELLAGLRAAGGQALPVISIGGDLEATGGAKPDAMVAKAGLMTDLVGVVRAELGRRVKEQTLGRVLVVDDSRTYREMLRASLQAAGYAVVLAETGEEGVRCALEQPPDAMLVDSMLPGISGPAVIRRIRSESATRRTPCVPANGF